MNQVDHRDRVLLFLKLFSSTEALECLHRASPSVDVATKLCALWIDELYIPGIRYTQGLKGDLSGAEVHTFRSQFTPSEMTLLEQFHRFLELRLEMLPKRRPQERSFPQGEFWQNIISHARRMLEEIDPEGLEIDEIVERSNESFRLSDRGGA